MNMDDAGNTFTIQINTVCKIVQIYKINSQKWNWEVYEHEHYADNNYLPDVIKHNGDDYRIMSPVNFNTPIMKNEKYWLLCPDFNNSKYNKIKILLPSFEPDKVDDVVTFKYSKQNHGQWMAVE